MAPLCFLVGDSTAPIQRESDGFLRGSHYLYRYSDVVCDYFRNLTEEEFVKRYADSSRGFSRDTPFVVSLFHELQLALKEGGPMGGLRSSKVTRIVTSWFEKMLYVYATFWLPSKASSPNPADNGNRPATTSTAKFAATTAHAVDSEGRSREISFHALKMKDILMMDMLHKRIGSDKIYLLRMLIGPLHGINVRNLLWHGFVAGHEFPVHFACLIFALLLSLAKDLSDTILTDRYQLMLEQVTTDLRFFDKSLLRSSPVLRGSSPQITEWKTGNLGANGALRDEGATAAILELARSQRSTILQLIKDSSFCHNGFKKDWAHGVELALSERHFEAMTIFFPLLEASLRKAYVDANDIQTFRLTAEPDTLCLSLDLILEDWLDREILIQDRRTNRRQRAQTSTMNSLYSANGEVVAEEDEEDDEMAEMMQEDGKKPNLLFEWLGPDNSAIVFDLLIWADNSGIGRHYRPRDHMAHGSALPSKVSRINSLHLLLAVLTLMQHKPSDPSLSNNFKAETKLTDTQDLSCILQVARNFTATYQPTFHKKRSTIDNFISLSEHISSWQDKCESLMTPLAVKLMEEATSKDLKSEELAWVEYSKERLIDLNQTKERFSAAVAKVIGMSGEEARKKDVHLRFPVTTPISISCFVQLSHTNDMISSIRKLLDEMYDRFKAHVDMVSARTAWLTDRRNFVCMYHSLPLFKTGVEVVLLIAEEILSHEGFASTADISLQPSADFPTFIWALFERMIALNVRGKFKSAEEVLACMLAPIPKTIKFIGRGEGFRCWLDSTTYLSRLEARSKGLPLGPEDVWNNPKNSAVRETRRLLYGGKALDVRTQRDVSHGQIEMFLLAHNLGSALCILPKEL